VLNILSTGRGEALWSGVVACRLLGVEPCEGDAGGLATLALRSRDEALVVAEVEASTREAVVPRGTAVLRLRQDGVLELWLLGHDSGPRLYCPDRLAQTAAGLPRECGGLPSP